MTNLGDDAEAFFRSGDEGTYEGGPASIVPFVVCEEEPLGAWDLQSADEWIERRRRLKRFVVTVVGGTAGLVILSVCLLAARTRGAEDANLTRQAAPEPKIAYAPVVPAATAVVAAPAAVALAAAANVATEPTPSPAANVVVDAAQSAEANVVTDPAPAVKDERTTQSKVTVSRRPAVFVPVRAKAARTLPRGSADLPAVSAAGSGPPTASFAN